MSNSTPCPTMPNHIPSTTTTSIYPTRTHHLHHHRKQPYSTSASQRPGTAEIPSDTELLFLEMEAMAKTLIDRARLQPLHERAMADLRKQLRREKRRFSSSTSSIDAASFIVGGGGGGRRDKLDTSIVCLNTAAASAADPKRRSPPVLNRSDKIDTMTLDRGAAENCPAVLLEWVQVSEPLWVSFSNFEELLEGLPFIPGCTA
ncbi:hypothetical protein BJ741DRAFT_612764 [Chytriomyces cf. hyalinus JEL632]|nr:hypothetical protein BJ741DRAFT_612764 [Chytriomyces cf. hyalinus JEL632]